LIGSFDGYLYQLDSVTGEEIWRFKTGGEIFNTYPFTVDGNTVYIPSFDNYLYLLDMEKRKVVWRFKTGEFGNAGSPVVNEDTVYHGSRDGIFYAIEKETGKEKWRFRISGDEIITTLPIINNGLIYFGCGDNNVYAISVETGKEVWRFRTSGMVYQATSIYDSVMYVGSFDCYMYAVDLKTREEIWRFVTSSIVQSKLPPAYESFEVNIKKSSAAVEDKISEDRYKSKKEETVSLSNYHVTSEYSSTNEYKQKSDYDTSFVMFEDVMEVEGVWTSDLVSNLPISKWR